MRFKPLFIAPCLLLAAMSSGQAKIKPHIVKGTTQLAGENGKMGVTYTIGKSESLNITLVKAKFITERFNGGTDSFAPAKTEKLLLLTYTIQNPNSVSTNYSARVLKFTAIDPNDENHEFVQSVVRAGGREEFDSNLKPAQKVSVQTAIIVPAKGPIPKLMVEHRNGGPVLRYNFTAIPKGLEKPFAGDDSYDAAAEVPAVTDTYYPMFFYDMKYVSSEFRAAPFSYDSLPEKNMEFFIAKFFVKLASGSPRSLRIRGDVRTEDGDVSAAWGPFKGGAEQDAELPAEFGQEVAVRLVFKVAKGSKIKTMRIWENQGPDSHVYVFPLELQAP